MLITDVIPVNKHNDIMKFKLFLTFTGAATLAFAEHRISKEEYVEAWSGTAIQEMVSHKIPASITIAQGILESGSGNSDLARKGNNHFGIKCHDWGGDRMFLDDDKKDECFRVYAKAEESFADHSVFLTGRSRYNELFTFDITDYKAWAKGLKAAGYATNPKYPDLLISIIEDLKLYELDQIGDPDRHAPGGLLANEDTKTTQEKEVKGPKGRKEITMTFQRGSSKTVGNTHTVAIHENRVRYVVAKKGDTFYRIAEEFDMALWQLYKYNDFAETKDVLEEGDIVYLQPKRRRAKQKGAVYSANETLSLKEISQINAIRLESLMKMNNIASTGAVVEKGTKIILR